MARPRNIIPRFISFDMEELSMLQAKMNDSDLAKFWRSAVKDLRSGCSAETTDPYIRRQFEIAQKRMNDRQILNENYYRANRSSNIKKVNFKKEQPKQEQDSEHQSTLPSAVKNPENKRGYGPNRLVMLSDAEGASLRELYGEDLELAIEILNNYGVNNPKKFAKYKDHASVMRKGNWVWNAVQETKTNETRRETAEINKSNAERRDGRSFREREMDARGEEAAFLLNLNAGIGG